MRGNQLPIVSVITVIKSASIMNNPAVLTGYGPSHGSGRYARLMFDGDERKYEQWEVKFLGYMRLQKLKDTIVPPPDTDVDAAKNEEAFAELIQFLDDKSLSLVMRDAKDDGKKALGILRQHYAGSGKPRIISLYTELTSLVKRSDESVTDYVIRAETAAAALNNADEKVSDSLLIAMVLKGLPESFKPFVVVVTQSDKQQTFVEFKAALRSFEDTERTRIAASDDSVMKTVHGSPHGAPTVARGGNSDIICYRCKQAGHIARFCESKPKLWCSFCRKTSHTDSTCRSKSKANKDKVKVVSTIDEPEFVFKTDIGSHDVSSVPSDSLLVDCGATAHIVTDKSKFTSFDESFRPDKHYIELANGTKSNNIALARGDVAVRIKTTDGQYVNATLKNALYVPSFPQSIFSVQAATAKGVSVIFEPDHAELVYKNGTVFDIQKHGKLYYLDVYDDMMMTSDLVNYACDLSSWHAILGHCNYDDVLKLESVVDGMKVIGNNEKPADCNVCMLGKMTQGRNRNPRCRSTVPLALVHTDLAGPIEPVSSEGFRYAIAFTDDYSGVVFVYFLKSKSDAVEATERFLADSAPFGKVKCLRSDNGSEFLSQAYKSLLKRHCIRHDTSAPYSPHQNGTAERHWRTLFEMGRCLLIQAILAKELWPYAVQTAAYIRNRCYNNRLGQTPYFALTGRKPNLSNMRVFGSECFAYKQDKGKLDTRCTKGIFLGYDKGSPAYLVYFPETGKVMRHRVVKFAKPNQCVKQQIHTDDVLHDDDFMQGNSKGDSTPTDTSQPTEGSQRGPGAPKCVVTERVAGSSKYPTRERKAPAHLSDYVTGSDFEDDDDDQVMSSIDYCYKVSAFPQNYKEAIQSPESEHWKNAMEDEINSLKENNTFTLTTLPEGRKIVGGRWVYTVKENPNDPNKTYKARYVAKGYSQVKGVDYEDTFAPTANFTSIRILMQLAAQYDLILHQMDVKTAYLNAPIDCEIFMEQPEGFEVHSSCNEVLVYKLNKSLYGLKQSGRNWNYMLHSYLVENHFVRSDVDNCVYVKQIEDKMIVLVIWVDDLIIGASNDLLLCETKNMLKEKFKMKDLGKLSHFLGIDFEQGDGFVKVNQKEYLHKVLERFGMSDCKPRSTPSELKVESNGNEEPVDPRIYREAIGCLIYAMICTRPDICWIVTKLSQYLSKPLKEHWVAVKHVLRYLKYTLDYELCYRKCSDGLTLIGYSDADWASSTDDRRSITGYCFSLTKTGPLISWKSRKQRTVALSSCEAEYMALSATIQEGLHLTQLLKDIDCGHQFGPTVVYDDNQGAIALSKNPVNRQRSKHIDVRYHFIRIEVNSGRVVIEYCPTHSMIADVMTKPVTKVKLNKFKNFLFGQ